MNSRVLCFFVLSAVAGVAAAQSAVTLTGVVDVNARYVRADGQPRRFSEGTDGLNSSELIFRGIEDLGGGLKAGFVLRTGINPDVGTSNTKFWNRRSTVSLISDRWGELRLGRDYVATLWNQAFDAFGFVGIGGLTDASQMFGGLRSDNGVSYFLPNGLGGVYGQFMVTAAEGGTTNVPGSAADKPGTRYTGGRVGYASGPVDVSFSAATQRYVSNASVLGVINLGTSPATILAGQRQITWNVAGQYDFGVARILAFYDRESIPRFKGSLGAISAVVPFGLSEVHLGYSRSKLKNSVLGSASSVDMFAGTYQYNLSKRTALYGTVARVDNLDKTNYALPGAAGFSSPGGKSTGGEFGMRHIF